MFFGELVVVSLVHEARVKRALNLLTVVAFTVADARADHGRATLFVKNVSRVLQLRVCWGWHACTFLRVAMLCGFCCGVLFIYHVKMYYFFSVVALSPFLTRDRCLVRLNTNSIIMFKENNNWLLQ